MKVTALNFLAKAKSENLGTLKAILDNHQEIRNQFVLGMSQETIDAYDSGGEIICNVPQVPKRTPEENKFGG